jgi:hypothetical protein
MQTGFSTSSKSSVRPKHKKIYQTQIPCTLYAFSLTTGLFYTIEELFALASLNKCNATKTFSFPKYTNLRLVDLLLLLPVKIVHRTKSLVY